jgi:hypothetical protein
MVLIQTNEFATKGQNWFLKSWQKLADDKFNFIWTDVRKDAHDFKHMDDPDFLMLLDFMAAEYWQLNITYVTPKEAKK